jgi:hypothetical protein
VSITTPLRPETPEELAARVRGLHRHLNVLRDHAGIPGIAAASNLAQELDYIAMRIETGPSRPAFRGTSRQPNPEHPA